MHTQFCAVSGPKRSESIVLHSICEFIVQNNWRVDLDGHLYAVRFVREGCRLAGARHREPEVGFFGVDGALLKKLSLQQFAAKFVKPLLSAAHQA